MKQPELGRKIAELRRTKGMTQEDLVEKCNVSVRTIQRIESGEVTPRAYTIKIIMAALDYDAEKFNNNTSPFTSVVSFVRDFLQLDLDTDQPSTYLIKQLNMAWVFGILYFLVGFFEAAAEHFRYHNGDMIFGTQGYIVIKFISLICYIYFQRGFIILGTIYKNYLLRIISFILIFGNMLVVGYDITSVFYYSIERQFILGAESLSFGGLGIIYGIALLKLPQPIRRVASLAGTFEIIAGCFFLTIVLAFVGFIVLIPAEILEIVILFKVVEIIRTKEEKNSIEVQYKPD